MSEENLTYAVRQTLFCDLIKYLYKFLVLRYPHWNKVSSTGEPLPRLVGVENPNESWKCVGNGIYHEFTTIPENAVYILRHVNLVSIADADLFPVPFVPYQVNSPVFVTIVNYDLITDALNGFEVSDELLEKTIASAVWCDILTAEKGWFVPNSDEIGYCEKLYKVGYMNFNGKRYEWNSEGERILKAADVMSWDEADLEAFEISAGLRT